MLATTTSVENTGLLDMLISEFYKISDYEILAIPRGTGIALGLAYDGEVDAILVHAPEQEKELEDAGVIIPEKSVDTLSLLYYARVAMTAGGTMGRESALMGTPTIYSFPLELDVSTYIAERGFPPICSGFKSFRKITWKGCLNDFNWFGFSLGLGPVLHDRAISVNTKGQYLITN